MIGKAPRGPALFDVGNVFDLELPVDSAYAQLARAEGLVRDANFADRYCEDNGRPSISQTQRVLLVILQYQEGLSAACGLRVIVSKASRVLCSV